MRKEYNDRWNAPLVNPGFTLEQYENAKTKSRKEGLDKILVDKLPGIIAGVHISNSELDSETV